MIRSGLKMTVQKRKQVTIEEFFSKSKKSKPDAKTISTDAKVVTTETDEIKNEAVNNRKSEFVNNKLGELQRGMLQLEVDTMEDSWFNELSDEFTKPYFLGIKAFLKNEKIVKKATIFPPEQDIYSWSRLTPFKDVKVVIIGQDPYHNFNQAHGLAFSVKKPTPAPPSLKNIYKELKNNYSDFVVDNKQGDLTHWSKQGVLLLNTALTVRAHNANSHAKCGWNIFTRRVVELLIEDRETTGDNLVFMLWGNNAIKLVEDILKKHKQTKNNILVLKSVHPSPLSASRGFFNNNHFKKINEWLEERNEPMIDWSVVPGTSLNEVAKYNEALLKK
ncbi:similar to Saccharomyces cerevisiae YML021C UNG1 Uracil-DNA glycosylase [Maudiozyma barnettii]|uniref:Uracil-DNA glycosylase n=1 Tax=Maudiozyma barnettii TaxID=61262 RepID=A0A8H2ZI10_9SACH|nr:uracil-DNA glycosylase [Kazachstania barnettii]CAB4256359.1 similar to Saccharomyces cerevisiae YML021C UNG1 Uracil-DNA glycosylase [Kazachstania barnettii]CAD1784968.1 similar to Saccharomyces cerevisiae YML021C UNG1 Uracil-DNA glycosylase [Kazachstania barnettii]